MSQTTSSSSASAASKDSTLTLMRRITHTRMRVKNAIFASTAREYTFDVRYTSREVHDRARRNLYHAASEASSSFGNSMAIATTTAVGSAESAGATNQLPIGSMHQLEDSTHNAAAAASPTSLNRITSPASHSDSMASMEEVSGGSGVGSSVAKM